jgi:PAS domain S-box-containing protein
MEVNVSEHPILPEHKETRASAPCEDHLPDHPGDAPANDHLAIFTKFHTKHFIEAKESKRKKAATNDYAKHFRNYFALTNDVLFSYDNQLRILSISPNVERILGYKTQELVGRTLGDLNILHPYSLHEATQNALQIISGKDLHSSVYQFITRDGTTLFGEVSSVPMIHKGHVVEVVSVARDITQHKLFEEELKKHRERLEDMVHDHTIELTSSNSRLKLEIEERKHSEAALRESEEKYRILVDNANEAIFVLQDGMFKFANPRCVELSGYSNEELASKPFDYLVHPEDRDKVVEIHRRRMRGEKIPEVYTSRLVNKEGDIRWVEVNVVSISWKGSLAALTFLMDITERIHSEAALKERQARLDSIFRAAPTGIGVITNRILLEVNDRLCELTGYMQDELIGKSVRLLHPSQQESDFAGNECLQILEKGMGAVETTWMRKDGGLIDVFLCSTPIFQGDPTAGVTFTALDITARKSVEKELKKHRDRLEELVKERTLDLTKAYELLKLENDVRKNTEATLKSREIDLEEKQIHLEEMNAALRVLIRQRDEDKASIEANIITNIKSCVLPFLEKLKITGLSEVQKSYLCEVELQLRDIASSYIKELSSGYIGLSPCEIQVAILIKEGKSSKDIAKILNISLNTVLSHRYYIRIKTGLKGKKANLSAYLQTLK